MLMSLDDLVCKAECADVILNYGAALDRGANSEAADFFADDGVLKRPDGEISGAAIRELLLKRPANVLTRHLLSNVVVRPTGPDTASAIAYIVIYRAPGEGPLPRALPAGPGGIGEWRTELRRTPEGWRFTRWEATGAMEPEG
jgi:hypothetical protein